MSASSSNIPEWECQSLIGTEGIGRICVIDTGVPLAFPVNYRVVSTPVAERIVFRTAPTSALARCVGPASMEIDDIDADRRNAWSVIVRGELRRVIGQHELPDPHPLITEGRYQWMVLDPTATSGRRFRSEPATDGFSVEWQPIG